MLQIWAHKLYFVGENLSKPLEPWAQIQWNKNHIFSQHYFWNPAVCQIGWFGRLDLARGPPVYHCCILKPLIISQICLSVSSTFSSGLLAALLDLPTTDGSEGDEQQQQTHGQANSHPQSHRRERDVLTWSKGQRRRGGGGGRHSLFKLTELNQELTRHRCVRQHYFTAWQFCCWRTLECRNVNPDLAVRRTEQDDDTDKDDYDPHLWTPTLHIWTSPWGRARWSEETSASCKITGIFILASDLRLLSTDGEQLASSNDCCHFTQRAFGFALSGFCSQISHTLPSAAHWSDVWNVHFYCPEIFTLPCDYLSVHVFIFDQFPHFYCSGTCAYIKVTTAWQ